MVQVTEVKKEIKEDSNSGKLDFLAKEALQDQKITDENFELLKDNPYHP